MSARASQLRLRAGPPLVGVEWLRGSLLGRNHALARLLAASFISTTGDRLHQMALAALILGLTNSMVSAGLVFVVSTLPYALFGLIAGALVDRWDRRRTMVIADLVRGVLVATIPLAAMVSLPLVYVILFALSCATLAFNPSRQASIPDLVDAKDLQAANSLLHAANYTVDLLAFTTAGALVAVLVDRLGTVQGTHVAFGFDALSYLCSALLLLRLPLVQRAKDRMARPLRDLPREVCDGLRFLHSHAQVRTNTILFTVGPLLLGSLHTLWIGFAWRVSHTGAFGYGITETCNAIGTLVGLLVLRRLTGRLNPGRTILVGVAIMGLSIAAAGFTDSLLVVGALAMLGGLGNMVFLIPSVTLVQRQTPPELRGRVFGVRGMLTYTGFSLSNAVAGGLSDVVGVSPLLIVLGGGMLCMALLGSFIASARDAA
jgi:DHA3 family macrolide efflux protein-like MFS transporter